MGKRRSFAEATAPRKITGGAAAAAPPAKEITLSLSAEELAAYNAAASADHVASLQLRATKAEYELARRAKADAEAHLARVSAQIGARHQLAPGDKLDLVTGAITRGGAAAAAPAEEPKG